MTEMNQWVSLLGGVSLPIYIAFVVIIVTIQWQRIRLQRQKRRLKAERWVEARNKLQASLLYRNAGYLANTE